MFSGKAIRQQRKSLSKPQIEEIVAAGSGSRQLLHLLPPATVDCHSRNISTVFSGRTFKFA